MGDLSENFSRIEFRCHCVKCEFDTVDAELLTVLQVHLRDYYNRKLTVLSGCRCKEYNAKIGGSENSWHMKARAADVVVEGVSPLAVYTYLNSKFPGKYGLGLYEDMGFVHVDTRREKARWGR